MNLIDADELFKSFESEENPEDSLWTLYGIKRKIEDAPRQEPCEDATLRDIFCMGCEYKEQELKTGHWIYDDECHEHGHCSECGYGSVDLVDGQPHDFCRRCGAKMVEPQEREDTDD